MVGKHKGMVSLLKKEMDARGIKPDRLVSFHWIVHQQSFCAKSVKFDHCQVVTDKWYRWLQTVLTLLKKET